MGYLYASGQSVRQKRIEGDVLPSHTISFVIAYAYAYLYREHVQSLHQQKNLCRCIHIAQGAR